MSTAISWTDETLNVWEGCTKVAPGCDNCYAEARDQRFHGGIHWGAGAERRLVGGATLKTKLRDARRTGLRESRRPRVFVGSLMDWADKEAPQGGARERLWELVRTAPDVDWMMLTKRAPNIRRHLPADWGDGYPNVWLGVTVEDRRHGLPRADILRSIPAAVRFLSCEPLLEDLGTLDLTGIGWVIAGNESGPNARHCELGRIRSLRDQCLAADVAFHFKQWCVEGKPIHAPMLDGRQWLEFPVPSGQEAA